MAEERTGFSFVGVVENHTFSDGSAGPAYRLDFVSRSGKGSGEYFMPALIEANSQTKQLSLASTDSLWAQNALDVLNYNYSRTYTEPNKDNLQKLVEKSLEESKQLTQKAMQTYGDKMLAFAQKIESLQKHLNQNALNLNMVVTKSENGIPGYNLIVTISPKESPENGFTVPVGTIVNVRGESHTAERMAENLKFSLTKKAQNFMRQYNENGIDLNSIRQSGPHDWTRRFVNFTEQAYGVDFGLKKNENKVIPKFSKEMSNGSLKIYEPKRDKARNLSNANINDIHM